MDYYQPFYPPLASSIYLFTMKKLGNLLLLLLCTGMTLAQATLSGTVTDEQNEPIAGANVFLATTKLGTVTDANGRFEIPNVEAGSYMLRISYVGYETAIQTITISNTQSRQTLAIQLAEKAIDIGELIVKATRAGEKTPVTYTNLNKEELEENNLGQDVPYLLQWSPSTVVTSDAGAGIGYTGIRIRGSDPTRINVTINGVPLNDAESQGVFWVNLPDFASSVQNVQIQRGVGTSTNGAGAFGATINLNTNQLQREPYGVVAASAGSFNTLKGNVQFGSGLLNNNFTLDGRISRIQSDGYVDRASADLESFYLSGAYLGERNSLRLNVFSGHEVTYQAWNGIPKDYLDDKELRTYNPAGERADGSFYNNQVDDYQQTHYQALFNQQFSTNWNLNLALHYTKGQGFYEEYRIQDELADYGLADVIIGSDTIATSDLVRRLWLDNHFYGTTYSLNYISTDNRLDATLGGGWHQYLGNHFGEVIWAEFASDSELGDRFYDNDATKTDFNLFGKVNYGLTDALNGYLDLQYRRVDYEFLGFNRQGNNVTQHAKLNFFNPKVGLFYAPKKNQNFYASFAVGNREPNRNDYTESTTDTRPEPETLYNTEIGFRQNWNKAALDVNVYHMLYHNQLAVTGALNDIGEAIRVNIPESYRLGLEVVGGVQILPKLNWTANATISQNKVHQFTEFADEYDTDFNWIGQKAISHENTDLPFSPKVVAGSELTVAILKNKNQQNLDLSLLSKYVGQQFLDLTSDENNVLDSYFFSNVRLKYKWQPNFIKEIELTLLVQNIFNATYETNGWSYRYFYDGQTLLEQGFYPQAGTNVLIGMTVQF